MYCQATLTTGQGLSEFICGELGLGAFEMIRRDNVRDHRAGTSDHPLQKRTQIRLRVHHIVIPRLPLSSVKSNNHRIRIFNSLFQPFGDDG